MAEQNKLTAELENALREMIEARTFSLDGVKAIEALREENFKQSTLVEELSSKLDKKCFELVDLGKRYETASLELTAYKNREADLVKRERQQTKLECNAEKHEAVANAFREAFTLVFKNPVVQNSAYGSTAVAWNGGYTSAPVNSTTETKVNP